MSARRASPPLPDAGTDRFRTIDGFRVFLDDERYSPAMIARIESDRYENDERALVGALLRDGDRVLESATLRAARPTC